MTHDLSGDIVIDEGVRFSDRVGSYVTNEQVAVLYQTAERLGKIAVPDRYPTDPLMASLIETGYGGRKSKRNEHGVPEEYVWAMMKSQSRKMGWI